MDDLASKLKETLKTTGEERRNVILAALAEISALYLDPAEAEEPADLTTTKQAVS